MPVAARNRVVVAPVFGADALEKAVGGSRRVGLIGQRKQIEEGLIGGHRRYGLRAMFWRWDSPVDGLLRSQPVAFKRPEEK